MLVKQIRFQSVRIREPTGYTAPDIVIQYPLHGRTYGGTGLIVQRTGDDFGMGMVFIDPSSNVPMGFGSVQVPAGATGTLAYSITVTTFPPFPVAFPSAFELGVATGGTHLQTTPAGAAGTFTGSYVLTTPMPGLVAYTVYRIGASDGYWDFAAGELTFAGQT